MEEEIQALEVVLQLHVSILGYTNLSTQTLLTNFFKVKLKPESHKNGLQATCQK